MTGAKAGTLSFLVGGSEQSFTHASPILALMGQRIIHCGPAGSGLAAKICNNLILGVEQIVVAEAMLLGQRLGLDPPVLAGVINNSTGACWSSSVNNPVPGALPDKSPPCERGFEGGFATALMIKAGGVKDLLLTNLTHYWGRTGYGIGDECFKGIKFTSAAGRCRREDLHGGCRAILRAFEEGFFCCLRIFGDFEEIENILVCSSKLERETITLSH